MFLVAWLVGCATLAGEWEGELDCEASDARSSEEWNLVLDAPDDGEYEGTLEVSGDGTIDYEGNEYDYSWQFTMTVLIEPDEDQPGEDNEVDVEGEFDDCEYEFEGEDMSEDSCPDRGDDIDFDAEVIWAEAGLVTIESDDCEGELEPA